MLFLHTLAVVYLLSLAAPVRSLVSPRPIGSFRSISTTTGTATTTQLYSSIAIRIEDESAHKYMMARAKECAFSEATTASEAQRYLHEILHIQSGCVSGVLASHDLCDNIMETAEIVAHLREKVRDNAGMSVSAVASSLVPLSLVILAASVYAFALHAGTNTQPFTLQEWAWAARDGYLPTMIAHFITDGGLASADLHPHDVVPLTPQEWMWALQGGYLNSMLAEVYHYGGLAVDSADTIDAGSPFVTEEWAMAVKGGYLPTMLSHMYTNGGL